MHAGVSPASDQSLGSGEPGETEVVWVLRRIAQIVTSFEVRNVYSCRSSLVAIFIVFAEFYSILILGNTNIMNYT